MTNPITLKRFDFETVFVNQQGKIIDRQSCVAEFFEYVFKESTLHPLLDVEPLKMVCIPSGQFWMGAPETEKSFNTTRPQHLVSVPKFFMSQTPITQAQWYAVAIYLPKEKQDLDPRSSTLGGIDNMPQKDMPVKGISWIDAIEFCARLSRLTQQDYRLPSEAEWEYACRAININDDVFTLKQWNKTHYQPFHYGAVLSPDLANYDSGSNIVLPVNNFYPNSFGLYNMHGNIQEWCADIWHNSYNNAPNDGIVWDEKAEDNRYYKILENCDKLFFDKRSRVFRGGCYSSKAYACSSSYRDCYSPGYERHAARGFRVAMSAIN